MKTILLSILFAASTIVSKGQDSEIQSKIIQPYETAIQTLRANYQSALEKEQAFLAQQKKYDEAVQQELDLVKTGQIIKETKTISQSLKRLQPIYLTAKNKLDADKNKRLETYIEDVRRREGQSAANLLAFKTMSPAIISVSTLHHTFDVGAKSFSNRPYSWKSVPSYLKGMSQALTEGGGILPMDIKVKAKGMVYIGVDATNRNDQDFLTSLGFVKLPEEMSYGDVNNTSVVFYGGLADKTIRLPKPASWVGFIIVGNIQ